MMMMPIIMFMMLCNYEMMNANLIFGLCFLGWWKILLAAGCGLVLLCGAVVAGAYQLWKPREPVGYRMDNVFEQSDVSIESVELEGIENPFSGDLPVVAAQPLEELEEDPDFPGVAAIQAEEDEEVDIFVSPSKLSFVISIIYFFCYMLYDVCSS